MSSAAGLLYGACSPASPPLPPHTLPLNQKLSPAGAAVRMEMLPNTHALAWRDLRKLRLSVRSQGEPHGLFRRSIPSKVGSTCGLPARGLLTWHAGDFAGGRGRAGTYSLQAEQERRV